MSDLIDQLQGAARSFVGKRCVVYGGGLSRPLVVIPLDCEKLADVPKSKPVSDSAVAAVSGSDFLSAAKS